MQDTLKNFDIINEKKTWTRQQNRCYHRLNTFLLYWLSHGYQILRVDLTSSNDSDSSRLRIHYRLLRRKIEKEFGYPGIQDFVVETSEGNGVLHMLWAWKPANGYRCKEFFVGQKWLSKAWMKQHKASVVWITQFRAEFAGSRKNVSRYLVSHYVTAQKGFVRYSYSWGRSLGFSVVKFWSVFRIYWLDYVGSDYKEMLWLWEKFCQGERLPDVINGGKFLTITEMRGQAI